MTPFIWVGAQQTVWTERQLIRLYPTCQLWMAQHLKLRILQMSPSATLPGETWKEHCYNHMQIINRQQRCNVRRHTPQPPKRSNVKRQKVARPDIALQTDKLMLFHDREMSLSSVTRTSATSLPRPIQPSNLPQRTPSPGPKTKPPLSRSSSHRRQLSDASTSEAPQPPAGGMKLDNAMSASGELQGRLSGNSQDRLTSNGSSRQMDPDAAPSTSYNPFKACSYLYIRPSAIKFTLCIFSQQFEESSIYLIRRSTLSSHQAAHRGVNLSHADDEMLGSRHMNAWLLWGPDLMLLPDWRI